MSPSEIKVKLEPLVRKIFSLKPVLHGAPASGYRMAGITVTPPKITVEGPSSVMSTLVRLQTMPVDIQGARESVTIEPKIDYQGQSVKLLDKSIVVRVRIERVSK
jgi:hypothetical protein